MTVCAAEQFRAVSKCENQRWTWLSPGGGRGCVVNVDRAGERQGQR